MEKTIKVSNLLGSDIRSRSNAVKIEKAIRDCGNDQCVIDMDGVNFISRSFADELLEICKKTYSRIKNAHGVVETIIKIVYNSRMTVKKPHAENESVLELKDMSSLEKYFKYSF